MPQPLRRRIYRAVTRVIPPTSPAHGYVQFLSLLLVVALAGFAYLGLFGCGGSSPISNYDAFEPQIMARPHISGSTAYRFGERQSAQIHCSQVGGTAAETVTLQWSPPQGAAAFQFPDGREPDNIDTGPPFVWEDLAWSQATETLDVSYMAPPSDPYTLSGLAVNAVVVYGPSGASATATLWSTPNYSGQSAPKGARPLSEPDPVVWEVVRWLDSSDSAALDPQSANTLIEALRRGLAFVAIKVPGGPTPPEGESAPLPWIVDDAHPATLAIQAWGGAGQVYKGELDLSFAWMPFAASQLPTSDGDQWLTLVVAQDAPAYTGPSAEGFSLVSTLYLNLADRPDAGEGTVLESYICYQGTQEPPAVLAAAGPRTYQGYGITAYGPLYQTLHADPTWELVNTTYQEVDAGEQLQLEHHIIKSGGALDLDLTVTSTLPVAWTLYDGGWDAPNWSSPIDGRLHVNEVPEFFWLVSDQVPASVPDGPYEVYVTAQNGDGSQTVTDIIWVGEWVAPPAGPPAEPIHAVALPIVTAE